LQHGSSLSSAAYGSFCRCGCVLLLEMV
jgi:hypothetical protein